VSRIHSKDDGRDGGSIQKVCHRSSNSDPSRSRSLTFEGSGGSKGNDTKGIQRGQDLRRFKKNFKTAERGT